MATPVNDRLTQAVASGAPANEVFTYTFPISAVTDVQVDWKNLSTGVITTLVYNVDYTLDINTSTITVLGPTTSGDYYTMVGVTPYARNTDFTGATAVTVGALNSDYNNQERQIQQLARNFDFTVHVPIGDNLNVNLELPDVSDRINQYIKFDNNGNITVSPGTGGGASGDVIGPNGATDNSIARFDGNTGEIIQDSGVIIDDSDAVTGATSLTVDNINIDGNTIISTNTNGNIIITPNGTGSIILDNQRWPQSDGTTDQVLSTNGSGQTIWKTLPELSGVQGPGSSTDNALVVWDGNSGALVKNSTIIYTAPGELSAIQNLTVDNINVNGSTISSTNTNGDIIITPNGTGDIVLDGLNWPQSDGANGQVLTTDGAGQLFFSTGGGGGGGVTGPVSSTNTAIATWNGTGGAALRNTATLIDTTTGKITSVGSTSTPGSIQVNEAPSNGSDGIVITAPSSVTAYNITLPPTSGSTGTFLVNTDGAGTLAWTVGNSNLLSTQTASASSSIVFTLPSGYNSFTVVISGIVTSVNGATLALRTSTDGGMSFTSSPGSYSWQANVLNSTSSFAQGSNSANLIQINGGVSNVAGKGLYAGYLNVYNSLNSVLYTTFILNSTFNGLIGGLPSFCSNFGTGIRNATEVNDAFQIIASSGNISTGTFQLYGIS